MSAPKKPRGDNRLLTRRGFEIVAGKCVENTETFPVRVIARAEGYAMVRRPGAMPFAVRERYLSDIPPTQPQDTKP